MRGVGVVGCGGFGPHLVRNLVEAGVPHVAVCDPHPDRVARVVTRHPGVSGRPDLAALLADPDIDAVVIATPPSTHFALATAALEAGRHVLVEKPMADRRAHAEALVRLARATGCVLAVDHTALFEAPTRAALDHAHTLGALSSARAVRAGPVPVRSDTDALWDLAPHDLAVLTVLRGAPPAWVAAEAHRDAVVVEADLQLGWDDGVEATLHVSWRAPERRRTTVLHGANGSIEVDALGGTARHTRDGAVRALPTGAGEPLRAVIDDFLAAVRDGRPPRSGAALGLDVVAVIDAAHRALEQRARVEVG